MAFKQFINRVLNRIFEYKPAPEFTVNTVYDIGDMVFYNGELYKVVMIESSYYPDAVIEDIESHCLYQANTYELSPADPRDIVIWRNK